jgi:hypothetical protein
VIEVADVFHRFAPAYLPAHGASLLSSHSRAIAGILACRTEALGGHRWRDEELDDFLGAGVFAAKAIRGQ